MNQNPIIKALQRELEKEIKQIIYVEENSEIMLNGKVIGYWNNEASHDYPEDLVWHRDIGGFHHKAFKAGHEAASARLLGLLEMAVEMADFYAEPLDFRDAEIGDALEFGCGCCVGVKESETENNYDKSVQGKKAREFLTMLKEQP